MSDGNIIGQIIDGQIPSKKLYEDDSVLVILDYNGASLGHTFVIPKKKYTIFEEIPDDEIEHLFTVANNVSVALFDHAQCQGTSIFITNGISAGQTIAHFMIHVIPRVQDDGIDLTWQPKQLDEEEMATVELALKDALAATSSSIQRSVPVIDSSSPVVEKNDDSTQEDFSDDEQTDFVHQINRIP